VRHTGRGGQDGFVREILWVSLVVLIGAVVVLDAVSLYSAYERVKNDTDDAARLARQVHLQELDVRQAEKAARALLERRGDQLTSLETEGSGEATVFIVAATRHVDTYAFGYLVYIPGVDDWAERTMNPSAAARSD
jgi:Flp pilus assembly protein TadG